MNEAKLHITDEEMKAYINNQLSSYHRQRVELEIQLCEACLERFIYWNSVVELSSIPQSDQAAEQIIHSIETGKQRKKQIWIQHPFAQVVVAASITLLLVGTGAISVVSSSLSSLEETKIQDRVEEQQEVEGIPLDEEEPYPHSNSDRWMDKAASWLDTLHSIRFDR